MNAAVLSLETANPGRYVSGDEVFGYFDNFFELEADERELYRKLLLQGPIRGRYIGVDHDKSTGELSQDELVVNFQRAGTETATEAAKKAIEASGISKKDISAVVVNTCTGYLCPGLSSYVCQELGLEGRTQTFDLMGMGCGAAIPNLQCSSGLLNGTGGHVLSIAVEVCSATMLRKPLADLIVSNSIFGDGAAAAVIGVGREQAKGLVRFLDFESGIFPEFREHLRYRTEGGKLRNVLSQRVPVVAGRTVEKTVRRLLEKNNMSKDAVNHWAVHPGGTAVLEQVGRKLGLSKEQLGCSYHIFCNYGNMSSASVMFVLRQILDEVRPQSGQKAVMVSFGAGFTVHSALVEFV